MSMSGMSGMSGMRGTSATSGHRRSRMATIVLGVALVGGVIGMDGVAAHLSSDRATSHRATAATTPAVAGTGIGSAPGAR